MGLPRLRHTPVHFHIFLYLCNVIKTQKTMATRKAINFYGTFVGLYEWGKGWVSHNAKEKWDFWWKYEFPKVASYKWHTYLPGNGLGECGRLVGNSNVIYMHPMAIYGTFVEGGISCGCYINDKHYKYVFYDDLESLNEICKAVAEYCGGTFVLDTTKEFEIVIPNERHDFVSKEDYMVNCGEEVGSFV